ncbi:hypothetical protein scyTo_0009050 [Scyliorhinus torazame]|uniref:Paralemmin-1 n=1 Tax=Scyliorhinus torazame TaxID=75743 RepID=A0A401PGD3_SCYTO|nr:hypothetical protein [Scyliorhinus torazame]
MALAMEMSETLFQQERLQAIAEKRKRQTEIENKKRQLEDERRQLQHLKPDVISWERPRFTDKNTDL